MWRHPRKRGCVVMGSQDIAPKVVVTNQSDFRLRKNNVDGVFLGKAYCQLVSDARRSKLRVDSIFWLVPALMGQTRRFCVDAFAKPNERFSIVPLSFGRSFKQLH